MTKLSDIWRNLIAKAPQIDLFGGNDKAPPLPRKTKRKRDQDPNLHKVTKTITNKQGKSYTQTYYEVEDKPNQPGLFAAPLGKEAKPQTLFAPPAEAPAAKPKTKPVAKPDPAKPSVSQIDLFGAPPVATTPKMNVAPAEPKKVKSISKKYGVSPDGLEVSVRLKNGKYEVLGRDTKTQLLTRVAMFENEAEADKDAQAYVKQGAQPKPTPPFEPPVAASTTDSQAVRVKSAVKYDKRPVRGTDHIAKYDYLITFEDGQIAKQWARTSQEAKQLAFEQRRDLETLKASVNRKSLSSAPAPETTAQPDSSTVLPRTSQHTQDGKNVALLLTKLGLSERVLEGQDFHVRVNNGAYTPLVIERHPYPDGQRLFLTHYNTDPQTGMSDGIDTEAVFHISPAGMVTLAETATQSPVGEKRGKDTAFAQMFTRNLLAQGFGDVLEDKWMGQNAAKVTETDGDAAPSYEETSSPARLPADGETQTASLKEELLEQQKEVARAESDLDKARWTGTSQLEAQKRYDNAKSMVRILTETIKNGGKVVEAVRPPQADIDAYREQAEKSLQKSIHLSPGGDEDKKEDAYNIAELAEKQKDNFLDGKLHVGDTRSIDGRTYRLNENHRWERVSDEVAPPDTDRPKIALGDLSTPTDAQAESSPVTEMQTQLTQDLEATKQKLSRVNDRLAELETERKDGYLDSESATLRSQLLDRQAALESDVARKQRAAEPADEYLSRDEKITTPEDRERVAGLLAGVNDKLTKVSDALDKIEEDRKQGYMTSQNAQKRSRLEDRETTLESDKVRLQLALDGYDQRTSGQNTEQDRVVKQLEGQADYRHLFYPYEEKDGTIYQVSPKDRHPLPEKTNFVELLESQVQRIEKGIADTEERIKRDKRDLKELQELVAEGKESSSRIKPEKFNLGLVVETLEGHKRRLIAAKKQLHEARERADQSEPEERKPQPISEKDAYLRNLGYRSSDDGWFEDGNAKTADELHAENVERERNLKEVRRNATLSVSTAGLEKQLTNGQKLEQQVRAFERGARAPADFMQAYRSPKTESSAATADVAEPAPADESVQDVRVGSVSGRMTFNNGVPSAFEDNKNSFTLTPAGINTFKLTKADGTETDRYLRGNYGSYKLLTQKQLDKEKAADSENSELGDLLEPRTTQGSVTRATAPLGETRMAYGDDFDLSNVPEFGFDLLAKSTMAQRRNANKLAIDVAQAYLKDGSTPGAEDTRALASYTGDGGVTGDINAHYTPTRLAATMWQKLHKAGFTGGKVLEPSMGAGVFMATAPQSAQMTGVELSRVTAPVAQLLHPDATIHGGKAFENYNIETPPDEQYDAVISNPPYGLRGWHLGTDKPELKKAEEYFIDTALDRLKDGGVGVFLVNPGPMQSNNSRAFRARLMARADILSVEQLPQATFKDSNSAVPPIVITLKKRSHAEGYALARLVAKHGEDVLAKAGVGNDTILRGEILNDPERIIGSWDGESVTGMYGAYRDIKGDLDDANLKRLADRPLMAAAPFTSVADALKDSDISPDEVQSALLYGQSAGRQGPKEGDISEDGELIFRVGPSGVGRWHRLNDEDPALGEGVALSKELRRFVSLKNTADDPREAEGLRQELNERLNAYLDAHGNPHDNHRLVDAMKHNHFLANLLAGVGKDGQIASYLTRPIANVETGLEHVDVTDPHSIATVLMRRGRLTPRNLAQYWRENGEAKSADHAQDFLEENYALSEGGDWKDPQEFYSGHVLERGDAMKQAAKTAKLRGDFRSAALYDKQAEQFENLIPPKSLEEFTVTPRDLWLPPEVVARFAEEVLDPDNAYTCERRNNVFYLERGSGNYGTNEVEELKTYLNHATKVDAVRGGKDMSGEEKQAAREDNIKKAKAKEDAFKEQFQNWLGTSDLREVVEAAYNKTFNSYLEPVEDGSALPLEGWQGLTLHRYQNQCVRNLYRTGAGLAGLDVGLGKTATATALAEMMLQEGRAKNVWITPPKSLFANWRKTLEKSIPHRKVLVIGETWIEPKGKKAGYWRPDDGKDVVKKLVQAAGGDNDIVLITRDWYAKIPVSPDSARKLIEKDVQLQRDFELSDAENDSSKKNAKGKGGKKGKNRRDYVKDMEKALADASARMFGDNLKPLYFEDLGVDAVISDESHCFPAGTLVDGRPIESIKAGDRVSAYDHATGEVVKSKVLNLQESTAPLEMFRLTLDDGRQIVSTGSHPYFTQDGYQFARDMVVGDVVYLTGTRTENDKLENAAKDDRDSGKALQRVPETVQTQQGAGLEKTDEGRDDFLLLEVVSSEIRAQAQRSVQGGDCSGEPAAGGRTARANGAGTRTSERPGGDRQDDRNPEEDRTQAETSGGQWSGADGGAGRTSGGALAADRRGVGGGVRSEDVPEAGQWLPRSLQTGLGAFRIQNSGRGGRVISSVSVPQGPRPEEGSVLSVARVARIEVYQSAGDGQSSNVCPGGVVYNLEVEGNHNYFANGVLVHNCYKNLYSAPTVFGESPKFMGSGGESKRAMDFLWKSQLIREKHNDKNVYLMTATPTKNSPLEVFNMLKHCTDALNQVGVPTLEAFMDRFCEIAPDSYITPDSKVTVGPCVTGFKNLNELRGIMRQFIFRRTGADGDIVEQMGGLPERDDVQHFFEMEPDVAAEYQNLAAQAKEAAANPFKNADKDEHFFSFYAKMKKLTLDPGLHDGKYAEQPNPRFEKAADIASESIGQGGKLVMFMDMGKQAAEDGGDREYLSGLSKDELAFIATNDHGVADADKLSKKDLINTVLSKTDSLTQNAYDRLVDSLVRKGVPREQIAVVTADTAKSSSARDEIKERYNAGDLKVVIGSTGVIGEGFSLQIGTTDMVHLDTPWDPGTYWQRLGRAVRQGNKLAKVKNHLLFATGSFDAQTYGALSGKQGWTQQLWDSTADEVDNTASKDRDELMAMLSGDPNSGATIQAARAKHAEAAKEAGVKSALRRVGDVAKLRQNHALAQQTLAASQAAIEQAQSELTTAKTDGDKKKFAGRVRFHTDKVRQYTDRVGKLGKDLQSAVNRAKSDPAMPASALAMLQSGKEFIADDAGNTYVPGGILKFSLPHLQEQRFRVDELNHIKQTVKLSPFMGGTGYGDKKPFWANLGDLKGATERMDEATPEMEAEGVKNALTRNGPSQAYRAQRDLHPDLVQKHFKAAHRAMVEAKPQTAYIVTPDGKTEYREDYSGIVLDPGERFLLNTKGDRELLKQTQPETLEYKQAYGLPFPHKYRHDVPKPGYAPDDTHEYAIKAPALSDLWRQLRSAA